MSRHSRSRTHRRNRGRFGPLFKLLCLLAVGVALTGGATVFFRVESVVISGNERYTQEEVLAASGIEIGDNLYGLNKNRIDRNIRTTLPYVGDLTINRSLPSTIVICITEWDAVAQVAIPGPERASAVRQELAEADPEAEPVKLAGQPWLISVKGKLLEPAPADSEAIVVAGLTAIDPQAGNMLEIPESERARLSALTSLLEALEKAGILEQVSAIRLDSTRLEVRYLERFEVKMKLNDDFFYNIRLMEEVRGQIEEKYSVEATGTIDLTQESYDAVYSPAPP